MVILMAFSCTRRGNETARVKEIDVDILKLLAQPTGHTVLSRQSLIRFGKDASNDSISSKGFIIPDERRTNRIAARVGGRIEKLYVRFPYQYIRQGEKLLDLYSPELTTAINEYLFLQAKDSKSNLTIQARQKLVLLGLSNAQVRQFEISGNAPETITVYSPYSGYTVPFESASMSGGAIAERSSSEMGGMGPIGNVSEKNSTSPNIREGSYVNIGQTLFAINDAQEVIALLSIAAIEQASVKIGLPVSVTSELFVKPMSSSIDLVEPVFQNGQRFLFVRAPLANSNGLLKFNSLVTAKFSTNGSGTHTLPASCIFDLGNRKIVWVKSGEVDHVNIFTPRIIITGNTEAEITEIISGLQPGELVARNAGLLVDREGIIKTKQP